MNDDYWLVTYVQYMKACGGRGSAPNPAGELTAPSRVQTPHP